MKLLHFIQSLLFGSAYIMRASICTMSLEGSTIAVNFFPVIDSIICEPAEDIVHTETADQLPHRSSSRCPDQSRARTSGGPSWRRVQRRHAGEGQLR